MLEFVERPSGCYGRIIHFHVDIKLHLERKTYTENIFVERKMLIINSLRPVSKFYAYYSSCIFTGIFCIVFILRHLHHKPAVKNFSLRYSQGIFLQHGLRYLWRDVHQKFSNKTSVKVLRNYLR